LANLDRGQIRSFKLNPQFSFFDVQQVAIAGDQNGNARQRRFRQNQPIMEFAFRQLFRPQQFL
jgi:hypothetical protein